MRCVHCGLELTEPIGDVGLYQHENSLQRCQLGSVPYGHMGHPEQPCPGGCLGAHEEYCKHTEFDRIIDGYRPVPNPEATPRHRSK